MSRPLIRTLPGKILMVGLSGMAWAGPDGRVGSQAELDQAIASGIPTIRLAAGVYDRLQVVRHDRPLRIMAADETDPPRFRAATIADSADVTLEHLVFDHVFRGDDAPLWIAPFRLYRSRNVVLDQVIFDGDLYRSASPIDDGFPGGQALIAEDMTGLTIRNSDIRRFWVGVSIFRSDNILFAGNRIHGLRKDGMNLAQVRDVRIENNHFHDFDRSVDSGDHADFIQLFSTNTTKPSVGVTIRDNILNAGHGHHTQSIFFRNDPVDLGKAGEEMFFRDVLIENNVIINGHLHGITIGESDGLTIRNNTLIRNRVSEGKGFSDILASPRITVASRSREVTIERNAAHGFPAARKPDWAVTGNLVIQDETRTKPGVYAEVFEDGLTRDPSNLAAFRYRAGGPLDGTGIGAPQLSRTP
ncbi:right-handed parallel beta-helix repeat-containing protein [Cereibacter sediminicola]|uniref:right-handed parallel beta-helix repeat-containing protein n=1 Tax=Cereibacter sediminicola TaxID=2584941 RepID=UPI00164254F2|nr:right-handed parallel beta-helix repeat-containing protein [Cereibacter sediminicola]